MNPLVSVIIPSYNGARYILGTVQSALKQMYQPIEIIVVDDGSKDNTEEILNPVMDRIRYIRKANGGPASARNAGMRAAKGEFIAFLDGDDLWQPYKLQRQMPLFADSDVGLVYADMAIIDSNGKLVERTVEYPRYEGLVFEKMFERNFIPTSTVVIRKTCLDLAGYFDEDRELISVEDYDLWLRIAALFKIRRIPEKLTFYRRHDGNISVNITRSYNGEKKILEKTLLKYGNQFPRIRRMRKKRLGVLYFELGREYWDISDLSRAKEFFKKSLSLRFKLHACICYIFALLGPKWINFFRKLKNTTSSP